MKHDFHQCAQLTFICIVIGSLSDNHDSDTSAEVDKGNYREPPKALVQA